MADIAHRLTDEKLEEMEKRLSAIDSNVWNQACTDGRKRIHSSLPEPKANELLCRYSASNINQDELQ